MNKNKIFDFIFTTLFISFFSSAAYAYIDPATGSMVIASIVAGFVMIRTAIRVYWGKFCTLFTKRNLESTKANFGSKITEDKDKRQ